MIEKLIAEINQTKIDLLGEHASPSIILTLKKDNMIYYQKKFYTGQNVRLFHSLYKGVESILNSLSSKNGCCRDIELAPYRDLHLYELIITKNNNLITFLLIKNSIFLPEKKSSVMSFNLIVNIEETLKMFLENLALRKDCSIAECNTGLFIEFKEED